MKSDAMIPAARTPIAKNYSAVFRLHGLFVVNRPLHIDCGKFLSYIIQLAPDVETFPLIAVSLAVSSSSVKN